MKAAINETIDINKKSSPNTNWELIKGLIRNTSIIYASRVKNTKEKARTRNI